MAIFDWRLAIGDWPTRVREARSAGVKTAMSSSTAGPQPSGCISARTTLLSKSLSVFEDKRRPGKAHASKNIERAKTEDVDAA